MPKIKRYPQEEELLLDPALNEPKTKALAYLKNTVEKVLAVQIDEPGGLDPIVDARKIYVLLAMRLTKATYEKIGKEINKDHSTVVYYNRAGRELLINPDFSAKYDLVLLALEGKFEQIILRDRYEYHLSLARKLRKKMNKLNH